MKSRLLRRRLLSFAVLALPPLGCLAPGHAQQPNILFIFSDDHRHDLLGKVNPAIMTPNLDALADSGVRFDRAFVTTAICSPSRAACLSGRYGSRNGVPTLNGPLDFPLATFAHDLAAAGYKNAQAGKWHLGTTPTGAGFHDYARINSNGSWFNRSVDTNLPGVADNLNGTFFETFMADVVIDWIDDHVATSPSQPFLMWWCNQVPHVDGAKEYPDIKTDPNDKTQHTPWGSAGGYRAFYDVADMVVPGNWADDLSTKPPYLASSRFVTNSVTESYGGTGGYTNPDPGVRNATLGEDNVQQHQLEYNASITALDEEIGRVLDRLEDPNGDGDTADSIADNTWVIFMGDNGWQTGHHKFTSKVLAYEESCRVPLIVKAPGVAPRIEDAFTLNIDLTAMFYDLAGLEVPVHLQGDNLRTLMENPATPWRSQFYYEAVFNEPSLDAEPHDAIRTEQYKLIRTYASRADAQANTGIVFEELYDLDADPIEMVNQADNPAFASVKADLVTALEAEKAAIASSPDPEVPPLELTTPDLLSNPSFDASPFDTAWTNDGLAGSADSGLTAGSTQSAVLDGTGSLSQSVAGLTHATLDFYVEPRTSQGDQVFELQLLEVAGGGGPTVVTRTAVADTYLRERSEQFDNNWGNDSTDGGEFLLGENVGDMRPLLRFDLNGVSAPPGTSLSQATLSMTRSRNSGSGGGTARLHAYGWDFVEGTGDPDSGPNNGATWNDPDGDDTDTPGGGDTTAGGTLGNELSSTDLDVANSPLFPSSPAFIGEVEAALGGNFNLIIDPVDWENNVFVGIESREKSGGTPATLALTFDTTASGTPVIRLRGTPSGTLEVHDGSTWVAVSGSTGALATSQATRVRLVLRDLDSGSPSYDLLWSNPGATTLAHSAPGLDDFANPPSAGGIGRISFVGDSTTEGTSAVDALTLVSDPAPGIRNGDFEDDPFLAHWLFNSVEETASFDGTSSTTAARFPFNVPSWLAQEIQPATDLTFTTLFEVSGSSNASLNLFLSDADFDTTGGGEIIGVRIPDGGGLQVNAGATWIDLLEDGTETPVSLSANTTYQLEIVARDLGTPDARWDLSWFPVVSPGAVEAVTDLRTFASLERATSGNGVHHVAFFQEGVTPSNSFNIDDVALVPSVGPAPVPTFHAAGLDGSDGAFLSWGAAQGVDPAIGSAALSLLDDDKDLIPGLAEYGLGFHLTEPDSYGDAIHVTDASGPIFTYVARSSDPSLGVVPQHSGDLSELSWSPFPDENEMEGVDQSGVPAGFERRMFSFPLLSAGFGRLEFELTP